MPSSKVRSHSTSRTSHESVTKPVQTINAARDAQASITVEDAITVAMDNNPQIHAALRYLNLIQSKSGTTPSLDDSMLIMRD